MKEDFSHIQKSLTIPLLFLVVIWLVKLTETALDVSFSGFGVYPQSGFGLKGILFMPFIHGSWGHLASNSVSFFVLATLVRYTYPRVWPGVWAFSWIISGLGVWIFGRPSFHIGASGLVFGFAFFLFWSGLFRKDLRSLAIALFVSMFYGSVVWGILPIQPGVSWEGHLFGAIGGTVASFLFRKVDLPPTHTWDESDPNAPEWRLYKLNKKPTDQGENEEKES